LIRSIDDPAANVLVAAQRQRATLHTQAMATLRRPREKRPRNSHLRPKPGREAAGQTPAQTLRYRGRLHHIGIGNPYAGWRVAMLIDGRHIEIVGLDGSPLRRLVLDPSRDYQRMP